MAAGDHIDSIDLVVQVNTGTDVTPEWTVIGGQKSAKLSRKRKTEEKTTKSNATAHNGYVTRMAGWKEWTVSCDGLKVEDDEAYALLEDAFESGTPVTLRWAKAKGATGIYTGKALVTGLDDNSKEKGPAECSVELEGDGAITKVTP